MHQPIQIKTTIPNSISRWLPLRGSLVLIPFVLTWAPSHLPDPGRVDPEAALRETEAGWRSWAQASRVDGPHREIVERSLITLKALTYQPTGGVEAPTLCVQPVRVRPGELHLEAAEILPGRQREHVDLVMAGCAVAVRASPVGGGDGRVAVRVVTATR